MVEIKKGDIVRLKSGGPDMTVDSISAYDANVYCVWIAEGKESYGYFALDSLELVEDTEG